jgi:hypothetical protein
MSTKNIKELSGHDTPPLPAYTTAAITALKVMTELVPTISDPVQAAHINQMIETIAGSLAKPEAAEHLQSESPNTSDIGEEVKE